MAELFIKDNIHESDNLWRLYNHLTKRVEALENKVRALEAATKDGLAHLRVE